MIIIESEKYSYKFSEEDIAGAAEVLGWKDVIKVALPREGMKPPKFKDIPNPQEREEFVLLKLIEVMKQARFTKEWKEESAKKMKEIKEKPEYQEPILSPKAAKDAEEESISDHL